jgi:broad specificity phosphatase PhoE
MTRPDPPTNYHITLLRHGESVGNAEDRLQGQADFPLTETGRQQSQALAKRWLAEGVTFDRVISSPLARSRETAEIIAAALDMPVEFNPVWMERNYGKLSGMNFEDATRTEGRALYTEPYVPIGETGESLWDLYLRGGEALRSLLSYPAGRYLIVSHGGILNMLLYAILGIVPQANLRGARFLFRNAAFSTLSYSPSEHVWRVIGMNDQAHWNNQG